MAEFRPDKPVEEEERTEDDDHAKTTEEEVQTEEGDQAKTNEQVSITMQIPRRNGQTMNQQEQLPRASSSTQVKLSYATIVSGFASSSSSAINEPNKKTTSSTVFGSAASSSSAINEASKKTEPTSSSTVSGLADSSWPTINEPNKKTESSSSSRNGESSGTVEIKREHVTQNLDSTSSATEQSQIEDPQEDSQENRAQEENDEDGYATPAWVDDLLEEGSGALDLNLFNVAFKLVVVENNEPNPQEQAINANPEHVNDDDVVVGVAQEPQANEFSSSSTVSGLAASSCSTINVESKKRASYASTVSGLAPSCSAIKKTEYSSSTFSCLAADFPALNEPSKKAESSSDSRNGESTGPVEINREHVTQNPMVSGQTMNQQTRASSSIRISSDARSWSPPNTMQQSPMANQMNITRPAFVEQNYVNHQLSGMHQLNLNAPTPMMYQQQNQMGFVPSPMRPETYQQDPYYLPMANQRMPMILPMISPSESLYFDLNWFNQQLHEQYGFPIDVIERQASLNAPWYRVRLQDMLQRVFYQNYINQQQQQHFGFPIGMTHQAPPPNAPRYDLNHQQMQQRRPQTQQPTQSQEFNNGQSSHQGQDKNQKPR